MHKDWRNTVTVLLKTGKAGSGNQKVAVKSNL
jgi:hypothetical protein